MRYIYILLYISILCSCKETKKDQIARLVKEWEGKEITIPKNIIFTQYGIDTLDYQIPEADYIIIFYIDSVGCTSCKLQFPRWKQLMHEMDSVSGKSIPFFFIFHPKGIKGEVELSHLMKRDRFDYPIWIDRDDEFNNANSLPVESLFHTILVDKQNSVIALGDPFQNHKIKEFYLKIISGDIEQRLKSSYNTKVNVEKLVIDLGRFDSKTPQELIFQLKNVGEKRLVINDIVGSCGCMSVNYSSTPVESGKELPILITYTAEKPEYINKTLTIHANIAAPLQLTVKGIAY